MSEQEHPAEEPAEPLDTGLSDESLPEIVIRIPVGDTSLEIRTDRADFVDSGTANARLTAVRIPSISYAPMRGQK